MKNLKAFYFALLCILTVTLSGCEVVGDIFKAGAWTAVIGIVVLGLIFWGLIRLIRGPKP